MHKTTSFSKKTLAVLLTALMLVSTLGVGLIVPATTALAAEQRSASLPMGDLTFVVPEAIYLYPNGSSWTAATSTPFQYYVNNDANGQPLSAAGSTGKIYYKYAYTFDQQNYGAETAAISYQFVDSSFRALSGGSVTLSGNTIASGGSVDITGGRSPSLGASVNGCYILWTLTLTDAADGKVKNAYALTYVYKPYVVPVGAMVRTKNQWGGAAYFSFAQQITWISGMHSITPQTAATHDGNYYPNYTGDHGMSAFITAGNTAYVGDTAYSTGLGLNHNGNWTASYAGATTANMAFLNTPTSTAHFNDTDGHDDDAATSWGSTEASAGTFNVSSFDYWYKENGLTDHNVLAAVYATPYGNISIDTSRYTDLKQIPNLAVGLMATDNEDGENGNWYVADYSTGSRLLGYDGTKTDTSSDSRSDYYNDRSYIIAGQGTNGWDDYGDYEAEGVKYAGAWPRTLQNVTEITASNKDLAASYVSTYNYVIKGMYSTEDPGNSSDYCFTHAMVQLTANQYNKSALRAAVQRAIAAMPSLGVNGIANGNITSCYFDANANYKWTALQAAFKNAVVGLTTLDSNTNPYTLAKALEDALDQLRTKVYIDANGGSFETLTTEDYVQIGTRQWTRYDPVYTNPNRSYYTFEGWSGAADSHVGLTYANVGYNNTIYATWKPVPYTITLLPADDDNVNTEVKTATYNIETAGTMADIFAAQDTPITDYPAPRQGFEFWYWEVVSADEGSNWTVGEQFYTADQIAGRHGNVRLKAHWAEGMVGVTVYIYEMRKNGSYLNERNRLVPVDSYTDFGQTNQTKTITPNARPGFTVNQQKSRLTGTVAANGSLILKIYYDRNQYNVTFVNFDGAVLQETRQVYNEATPIYSGATPRRAAAEGVTYSFIGWSDGSSSYTETDEQGNVILPEITADTTFTAIYSETETLYNVTSAAGAGTEITVDEGTYTYGTVLSVSASAQAGYIASGLKLYANGEEIANPSEYTVTSDVEFTTDDLELLASYIVSFYDAEDQKIVSVSVSEGGDATAAPGYLPAPEREGYTFAQWSLPVNNVTENMTVIAQYNKDGAVNYSTNFYQDIKLLATLVRESGEEFDFPYEVLGTPAKTGFTFMGWDKTFSPASVDQDVFAVFQSDGYVPSHTLTVIYNNGSENGVFTQEEGTTLTVNYPEYAGFVFTGWTGDTAQMNGTTYLFGEADGTITATWYDLTALNDAENDIDAILAESDLYRSDYILRLRALKLEKTNAIANVPASADDLDDLLARMIGAVAEAPDYLLYTLYVKVDGEVVETIKDIKNATVTITTAPEKSGFSFDGWTVTAGTVDGSSYTFTNSNAEADARWVVSNDSIAALRRQIEALSPDVYCQYYLDDLFADLEALEAVYNANPGDVETIAQMIEDLTAKLDQKDQHKHKFTVFVDYDEENPPTCLANGYAVYECENCAGKTKLMEAVNLGHDWGEWTVIREADYGVDGEAKRTCNRCGAEETVVLSLNDQSDKAIRFVTMGNMYYLLDVGDGVVIKTLTTYRWFSSQELKFKVQIQSGFAFPDYIVYLNGIEITPDGSGYYTVPADANLATVSIAGVVPDDPITGNNDSNGKTSFWEWLVNFFRSIAAFFQRIFGR